ncbi:hypothetical protein LCGC14_0429690 [marine sediment metagenome]|uniref:Uncharacterized protein n=1 Tax=marine sediment metagenome TaxID=412755 RepID=A0A0F9VXU8_9ZZZZ
MIKIVTIDFATLDKAITKARLRWEELQKENLTPKEHKERAELKILFFAENYGSSMQEHVEGWRP